tara:strand:- start:54 stop:203 length:150 start_codon:yes stop_codon:yes gene_type:complete
MTPGTPSDPVIDPVPGGICWSGPLLQQQAKARRMALGFHPFGDNTDMLS